MTVGLAKRFETIVIDANDISNTEVTKDNHTIRREGDYYMVNFESNSPVLHLIQRIRDEAHRFAVTYHTKVRNKRIKKSELESIVGVGPATRKKLIRHFGSVVGLKQASANEIAKIVGESKAKLIISQLGK